MISQGVVDNFLTMQTENSQQTQSLLVRFLNERIETAKTKQTMQLPNWLLSKKNTKSTVRAIRQSLPSNNSMPMTRPSAI